MTQDTTTTTDEGRSFERPVMPGYLVRGACGREWFVPLERVRDDYADFLMEADKLAAEDAMVKANANRDFWHTWFYEQCYEWSDIERLGRLVKTSAMFKTKAALDRRRGKELDVLGFFENYQSPHNTEAMRHAAKD
jgi:hypothetical protein